MIKRKDIRRIAAVHWLEPVASAVVQQPSSVPFNIGPDVALVGTVDINGYEWVAYNGANYWRLAGSGSNWTRHQ